MLDRVLSSEQISFFNGCVRPWKAELQAGIYSSTTSPTPLVTVGGGSPCLVLKVAWKCDSGTGSERECCI